MKKFKDGAQPGILIPNRLESIATDIGGKLLKASSRTVFDVRLAKGREGEFLVSNHVNPEVGDRLMVDGKTLRIICVREEAFGMGIARIETRQDVGLEVGEALKDFAGLTQEEAKAAWRDSTMCVACPKCNESGPVDWSPHVYFHRDAIAYRCRACKHVWEAGAAKPDGRATLIGLLEAVEPGPRLSARVHFPFAASDFILDASTFGLNPVVVWAGTEEKAVGKASKFELLDRHISCRIEFDERAAIGAEILKPELVGFEMDVRQTPHPTKKCLEVRRMRIKPIPAKAEDCATLKLDPPKRIPTPLADAIKAGAVKPAGGFCDPGDAVRSLMEEMTEASPLAGIHRAVERGAIGKSHDRLTGNYNHRTSNGIFLPWTAKYSPMALVGLCLGALDTDSNIACDPHEAPEAEWPMIAWDNADPLVELEKLCVRFDIEVVFNPDSDTIRARPKRRTYHGHPVKFTSLGPPMPDITLWSPEAMVRQQAEAVADTLRQTKSVTVHYDGQEIPATIGDIEINDVSDADGNVFGRSVSATLIPKIADGIERDRFVNSTELISAKAVASRTDAKSGYDQCYYFDPDGTRCKKKASRWVGKTDGDAVHSCIAHVEMIKEDDDQVYRLVNGQASGERLDVPRTDAVDSPQT